MSSELPVLTIRYPSGETEYRTSPSTLSVGDLLNRNGDTWIVDEVTTSAAGIVVRVLPGPTLGELDDEASR